MSRDWRDFRPAIWAAMIGIALMLVLNPPYIGAGFVGVAIGIAIKIERRRRVARTVSPGRRRR
jgi:hypothetical protein